MSAAPGLDPARMGGTWYIMPTPFDVDGTVDPASLSRLTEAVIKWGSDGFTALGVMGEASTLRIDERALVVRTILAASAGAPVAVGISAPTTRDVLQYARQAIDCGAAAVMLAAPQLLRNVDAFPALCAAVAELGVPLIVQDEPASTGVLLPISVLTECMRASGTPLVKLEDAPTPTKMTQLLNVVPEARIFGGLGGVSSYYELCRGAVGTMTGFPFPEVLKEVRLHIERGDRRQAFDVYARFLPLLAFDAQAGVGLGIRKEVLRRRGVLTHATTRIDARLTPELATELDELVRHLGIELSDAAVAT